MRDEEYSLEDEIEWERGMMQLGGEKFDLDSEKAEFRYTPAGKRFLSHTMDRAIKVIDTLRKTAFAGYSKTKPYRFLAMLESKTIAMYALGIMATPGNRRENDVGYSGTAMNRLAPKLAVALRDEIDLRLLINTSRRRADAWKKEKGIECNVQSLVERTLKEDGYDRRKLYKLRQFYKDDGLEQVTMTQTEKYRLGADIILMLVNEFPEFFTIVNRKVKTQGQFRTLVLLEVNDDLMQKLQDINQGYRLNQAHLMPMIRKPISWDGTKGGYVALRRPVVRDPRAEYTEGFNGLSKTTVRALNLVQDTPWSVNRYVLDVIHQLNDAGLRDTSLPQRPDTKSMSSPAERREALFEYQAAKALHYEERSIIDSAMRVHDIQFWFPHSLDFRTRMYPLPSPFSPQGSDLSKGLLQFARGAKVTERGLYWLSIAVANAAGQDKLSLNDRSLWTWTNFESIRDMVRKPMGAEWLEFDDPFQFIALAHELVNAVEQGSHYRLRVPVHLDGSCNGLQHLSLMGLDPVGAEATNCGDNPERKDLYQEVADVLYRTVQLDAANGDESAQRVLDKLVDPRDRRKVVKRSVMTVPYGVTSFGIREFMVTDGHVTHLEREHWNPSANYLRDRILTSLETEIHKAREIQAYFTDVAEQCAKAGRSLKWETHAGSVVTQSYQIKAQHRIKTLGSTYTVYKPMGESYPDISKMKNSAPPNIVHSADASHLQLSVCAMADAGIEDFAMVHDSFGTLPNQVDTMRDCLRTELRGMYVDDYLQKFHQSVEEHSGLTLEAQPPERGDFDVDRILRSDYVFA